MTFKRLVDTKARGYLAGESNKILFIWGPRRSGKTTLLERLSKELNIPFFDFDYETDRELFVPREDALSTLVSTHPVILIDEVQNFPAATIVLKLLHDKFRVKIIATGSSELRQKSGENFDSMAGRFIEAYCLPLSASEIVDNTATLPYKQDQLLQTMQNDLQIFGAYPEVYTQPNLSEQKKIDVLEKIVQTYVLKDVATIYALKNERLARDILVKIALQLGSEVSVRELASSLGANKDTVSNYIEIFIKNYILIPLPSFRTNIRKSVSENRKLYFYDLGIRNALVKDFRELHLRPDKGGIFENFMVLEMEKQRRNTGKKLSMYFYREYGGAEVDLVVEDYKKQYTTVEIKSQKHEKLKDVFPLPHTFRSIGTDNYFEEITGIFKG